ncbi:MAG: nucleotide exchange factor GrpE [Clostridiaceae bacterium]|nr:nucleotide exchange factor GrpE [Clostridiaceae bacterium]
MRKDVKGMLNDNQPELNEKNTADEMTGKASSEDRIENQNSDGNTENDLVQKLEEEIKKKEKEYEELLDRTQRLAAEYDNFRKRTQKEKEKLYDDAVCDVASKFLGVVDNLERALQAVQDGKENGLRDGVNLVYRQIVDVLEKLSIKPIEAVGKPFDPELHNAVMHVEDESLEENVVAEEFQKGYIYKDEIVIRHSMVKVAN